MKKSFFTDGKDLFDPTGKKVLLRGVNKMSVCGISLNEVTYNCHEE
jgi:hypothetical protein